MNKRRRKKARRTRHAKDALEAARAERERLYTCSALAAERGDMSEAIRYSDEAYAVACRVDALVAQARAVGVRL